jgi:hypothetical protein
MHHVLASLSFLHILSSIALFLFGRVFAAILPVTFNISFGIRYIMQHDIWQTWSNAPASTTQELQRTA